MNPLVLFFILGAATAEKFIHGLEKEGLQYVRGVEVPVVEQVQQNVGVTEGRTSQVGSVGITGRTDIPIFGQVSEGVVGTQTQYPVGNTEIYGTGKVLGGIVPASGVEYPVLRNGVEKVVQTVPIYGQVQNHIFRAFPHLDYDYPVQQTPIVKNVQYPFLDRHLEQDVYRSIPLHQKLSQLIRAFPYLYNRQYPVEPEHTGLQYPIGEKLEHEVFHGVQTPYLKNIRQGYPLVYNREYTGVRDTQMSETVRPIFRDIPVSKYEPYVNKFYGKQYNPIYRAFPYLYPQEYTTHFDKTYGKFPVTHSYNPIYSQDYFNTRFLDQDVFNRHVQEFPVYNKGFKYFPYLNEKFPLYKHESSIYKHEYPVYKHEYPVYKHEYPIYENDYIYKKYPHVNEPIEQTQELPLGYDYEVPFRTGYPVHETLGKTVSTFY